MAIRFRTADGTVRFARTDTLLTCPLNAAVTVQRVTDQDPEIPALHRAPRAQAGSRSSRSKSGTRGRQRQTARGTERRPFTIGARAASKVLVQAARVLILARLLVLALRADAASPPPPPDEPFRIADNSFLVEEAFNQEARRLPEHLRRSADVGGQWASTFTQEWPVASEKHQLSYTLVGCRRRRWRRVRGYAAELSLPGARGGAGAPRVLAARQPRAADRQRQDGRGNGSYGLQVNLPFSKRSGGFYLHGNAGFTWLPDAQASGGTDGAHVSETSPFVAGSAIYRLRPMLNLMLEHVLLFNNTFDGLGTIHSTLYTASPGVRGGWDVGRRAARARASPRRSPGAAAARRPPSSSMRLYELPFKKAIAVVSPRCTRRTTMVFPRPGR